MTTLFSAETRLRLAWFCIWAHVPAVLTMLLVILPGLLLGDVVSRREYVAAHATLWSLSWALWAPASLSLLLFYMACADALPHKGWGQLAVGLTLIGALVDWLNESFLIFVAPTWAQRAATESFYANLYAVWDRAYYITSMGTANLLYTLSGLIFIAIALQTPHFPRWLTWLGVVTWALSLAFSWFAYMGDGLAIFVVSSVMFPLFLLWTLLMGYGWLCAARPDAIDGSLRERLTLRETVRAMIPKHPLAMTAVFRHCFYVHFAVQPAVVRRWLPAAFEPDLYDGWAFVSVAVVQMEGMRPIGLPKFGGVTYNQVLYRVVVRYKGERGVYFLRSDTDNFPMALLGDWFTVFRTNYAHITWQQASHQVHCDIAPKPEHHADIHAAYDLHTATSAMPTSSKFKTLAEAKDFLVELFVAFGYDPLREQVGRVTVKRGQWDIQLVNDTRAQYDWLNGSEFFPVGSAQLDTIFYVEELPYNWYRLK